MKRKKILKQEFDTLNIKYRAFITNKGSSFVSRVPESVLIKREEERKRQLEAQIQIGEAEQEVAKQKTGKKKFLNLIFFLINILVVVSILIYQINQEGAMPIDQLVNFNLNGWFLVLTLMMFAFMMFLKSMRINLLVKQSSDRSRPFLSYKTSALGRYYDSITPMSAGGQPFQAFYLNSRGLPAASAIAVPVGKYLLSQVAWILTNIVVITAAIVTGFLSSSVVVLVFSIITFIGNSAIVAAMVIMSISERAGKLIVGKILKFLEKIKLIKDYEKQYNKIIKTVQEYQISMRVIAKNKKTFIFQIFLSLLIVIVNYSMAFFIYSALVGYDPSMFFEIFVKVVIIDIAAGFIPLPGGTGMSEISFTAIFASTFTNGTLFWALLFWRIVNYYSYIIQGIVIVIYDYILGNKKYYWQKKKWELEKESADFRNRQLANYKRKKRNFGVRKIIN